jgi:hypothetical protein
MQPKQKSIYAQGVFFFATGVWPILHLRSFEAVTGPKQDRWLVKTIGGLIAVVGATMIAGAREKRLSRAVGLLADGSALALATADIVYVSKKRISRIYLADALVELGFVASRIIRKVRR